MDRVVLGVDRPVRPPWALRRHGREVRVNAGDFHGLTPGSVLAVYSPAGAASRSELLGHARVLSTRPFDALVEPCSHGGKPAPRELPDLAACQVVCTDYRLLRFKVAVQAGDGRQEEVQRARAALRNLEDPENGLLKVVTDLSAADWVVRLGAMGPELREGSGSRQPSPLPPVGSADFADQLTKDLEKVYRARALLTVAERLEQERFRGSSLDLEVEVHLGKSKEGPGAVVPCPPDGWVFRPGDHVSFRARNRSPSARVDVQLLVVGLDFGIDDLYPGKASAKALEPGESTGPIYAGCVNEKPPFGREHLVAVATPARNPPIDFHLLVQGGLREGGEDSPLAQLLTRALLRNGTRSGLEKPELDAQAVRLLTWRTQPR
jgi:hypothetical protein